MNTRMTGCAVKADSKVRQRLGMLVLVMGMGCGRNADLEPLRVALRVDDGGAVDWDTLKLDVRALRFRPCAPRVDQLDWPGLPAAGRTRPQHRLRSRPAADPGTASAGVPASGSGLARVAGRPGDPLSPGL